jgi:hypothetical protein
MGIIVRDNLDHGNSLRAGDFGRAIIIRLGKVDEVFTLI